MIRSQISQGMKILQEGKQSQQLNRHTYQRHLHAAAPRCEVGRRARQHAAEASVGIAEASALFFDGGRFNTRRFPLLLLKSHNKQIVYIHELLLFYRYSSTGDFESLTRIKIQNVQRQRFSISLKQTASASESNMHRNACGCP